MKKQCPYCFQTLNISEFTREHIIPKSLGGTETISICSSCNNELSGYERDVVTSDYLRFLASQYNIKSHRNKKITYKTGFKDQFGREGIVEYHNGDIKIKYSTKVEPEEKKYAITGSDPLHIEKIKKEIESGKSILSVHKSVQKFKPEIRHQFTHDIGKHEWLSYKILYNFTFYILEDKFFKLPQLKILNRYILRKDDTANIKNYQDGLEKIFSGYYNSKLSSHLLFAFQGTIDNNLLVGLSLFNDKTLIIMELDNRDVLDNPGRVSLNELDPKSWKEFELQDFLRRYPPL